MKKRNLNDCIFHYFDEQYAFCRSCVTVNNETMEDLDNCRCLQCALNSLNNSCFHDYCTSKDEYDKLQIFIEQFQLTNGVVDSGVILKPKGGKFSTKRLSYFVGQNHTLFRNPLPFEKTQLISALLTSLTNNQNTMLSSDIFEEGDTNNEIQSLRKRRWGDETSLEAAGYEDENKSDSSAEDKKLGGNMKYHESKEISGENYSKDPDDESINNEEGYTKTPLFHTTKIDTTRWSSWEQREIFTSYLVDECQDTKMVTTVDTFYETKTETETRTTLITSTKAKRRWFPRTTIVISTATATSLSITTTTTTTSATTTNFLVTVVNPDSLKRKAGIRFGIFSASGEIRSSDERSAQAVVKRNWVSDPDTASQQAVLFSTTTSQVLLQPELTSGEYVSAASQLDKRIFIFTAITVSITTLMMLGFSYRSRVSFRDHSIYESEDDNDWSDEEVEFDEEYFYSLPVSIPERGISLDKMAQQLGVE